jgi:hypothetical protein
VIVTEFPNLFADFKNKQFTLLWRGSRDSFGQRDFYSRCDGHPNTLTVILDMNGNIFGGFTPVEWETAAGWKHKADPSLKSFLFTLKNPHNLPARRFGLKAESTNAAIPCVSTRGPHFGDICLWDTCTGFSRSSTAHFGRAYTNDTGLQDFKVKEIEVFEITD